MTDHTDTTATETTAAPAPKKAPTVQLVTMTDGREVEFAGKRKMQKTPFTNEKGIGVRLDFVNGETREFYLPESLLHKFAVHGAEQKLGDEIAGVDLVDDCVTAIDELIDRLYNGVWTVKREANALNGASILAKALVETSGKTVEEVRAFLAPLSAAQKLALRANAAIAPVIARLEAERDNGKAKKEIPNTDDLLAQLSAN